jgi:hypothetical protein
MTREGKKLISVGMSDEEEGKSAEIESKLVKFQLINAIAIKS